MDVKVPRRRRTCARILCALLALAPYAAEADNIRVAVASNFSVVMQVIAERFEAESNHSVTLVPGATGKHYAQIVNGAPFDLFFAADVQRPVLLEENGMAVPGSRFSYALGRLVLWSPRTSFVDDQGKVLGRDEFRHLAIANPRLAPYGQAAQQVLQALGVREALQGRLVRGENIAQTFQFVKSGNAELGFVAYSQVKQPGRAIEGSWWLVPQPLYAPIEQQAVLLKDTPAGRDFLAYVRSEGALALIRDYGYNTP